MLTHRQQKKLQCRLGPAAADDDMMNGMPTIAKLQLKYATAQQWNIKTSIQSQAEKVLVRMRKQSATKRQFTRTSLFSKYGSIHQISPAAESKYRAGIKTRWFQSTRCNDSYSSYLLVFHELNFIKIHHGIAAMQYQTSS
jgi:hypothetical protein